MAGNSASHLAALEEYTLRGGAMGTTFQIRLLAPPDIQIEEISSGVAERIESIEQAASTYRANSQLSLFNRHATARPMDVSPHLARMVALGLEVSQKSEGAYDITALPLVNLWGFGAAEREGAPSQGDIDEVLGYVGYQNLTLKWGDSGEAASLQKSSPGVEIDLSSLAKGYAVDEVAAYLDGAGIENWLVEIGGEIAGRGYGAGAQPWAIALEIPHPADLEVVVSLGGASKQALATSGQNRNYFREGGVVYSHIIDPRSGSPVRGGAVMASVLHEEAAAADAWATALMSLPFEEAVAAAESLGIAAFLLFYDPQSREWRRASTAGWREFRGGELE